MSLIHTSDSSQPSSSAINLVHHVRGNKHANNNAREEQQQDYTTISVPEDDDKSKPHHHRNGKEASHL